MSWVLLLKDVTHFKIQKLFSTTLKEFKLLEQSKGDALKALSHIWLEIKNSPSLLPAFLSLIRHLIK